MEVRKFTKQKDSQTTEDRSVYIGRDKECIYIGAPYHSDHAQIHLNDKQFLWLYKAMGKHLKKKAAVK